MKLYSAPVRPFAAARCVLLLSACATVRAPLSSLGDPFPQAAGSAVEPHLELWLEDSAGTQPEEKAAATREAREALQEVAANQAIAPDAQGSQAPLLVVREQAIARTESLRGQQLAAKIGLVAGVVVGAVVIAASASHARFDGPHHSSGALAHGAIAPHPVAVAAGSRLPPLSPRRAPRGFPGPRGDRAGPDVYLDLGDPWLAPQTGFAYAAGSDDAPLDSDEPVPPAPAELPPPPPLALDERGFFSGDLTRLWLDLIDQRSGQVLWSTEVEGESDPRDRDALARLFTQALAGQRWASAR